MLTSLIISFRESFEMLLVIVPLLMYIEKIGYKKLSKFVYAGSISGLAASVSLGVVLYNYLKTLEGYAENIFMGSMQIFVAALIVYYMVWVGGQTKHFGEKIEEKFNFKIKALSLFILAFLTIFRECFEITIFIIPTLVNAPLVILTGIIIGVVCSILLMFIFYKTTINFNINIIFDGLTLVLIFMGAMMFGEGLASLLPSMSKEIETAGKLIFALPSLFIFFKNEIGRYIKK